MKVKVFAWVLVAIAVVIGGCQKPQREEVRYDKPLPPGELALRKVPYPYEGMDFTFACYDLTDVKEAIARSLNYLGKPSSRRFYPYGHITHDHAVSSLQAFNELLESGLRGRKLEAVIAQKFDVYMSVGCDNKGTVLFTGYFTPIFDGSLKQTAQFQYPLYSQPKDLVKTDDGKVLGRRTAGGALEPYPARAQLEASGMLAGTELLWLADPFEVYIAHVQGSAKVRLPDGKLITAGYAATNGHEYRSIVKTLIKNGQMPVEHMNLTAMINYFKSNTDQVRHYTGLNPRFVFFQLGEGPPHGSLNEPVTAMRTIATDKSIYPRGCLAFMATELPRSIAGHVDTRTYHGFALDQDTGGAIRAPGRCDVYMGQGSEAGLLAGQTYQEGRLFYLFLKDRYLSDEPDDILGEWYTGPQEK